MNNKPFLCRLGMHDKYRYLPKVSGDLGEISIACKRCGWGLRYFTGEWDIEPQEVQDGVKKQAEIQYGQVLGWLRGLDPERSMQIAYDAIKGKFTREELKPIDDDLKRMEAIRQCIKKSTDPPLSQKAHFDKLKSWGLL